MRIISSSMKVAKDFNILEISFFKLYLIVVALLLSIWFPVILSANLGVYIVILIVSYVAIFSTMFKKQGNFYKTIFTEGLKARIFSNTTMLDISIFKTAVFVTGLLLAKLFPVLLTAHIGWYIWIAGLFIGYYIHWLSHLNKKK